MDRFWLNDRITIYNSRYSARVTVYDSSRKLARVHKDYPTFPSSPIEMAEGILYAAAGLCPAWLSIHPGISQAFIETETGHGRGYRRKVLGENAWRSRQFYIL